MTAVTKPIAVLALSVLAYLPAMAHEFPHDVPAREPGLWLRERTGTISDGKTAIEIRKTWNVCLDAKADRALRELEMRERQASVAGQDHGRSVIRMQRLGTCDAGLQPGDMMLMHWRVNGEETLKARQRQNILEEIARYDAFMASRQGR